MSKSGAWLVAVFSLAVEPRVHHTATDERDPIVGYASVGTLPFSHACTSERMFTSLYWYLSAGVSAIPVAIGVFDGGALLASIVPSDHAPLM
jgi:hypothetical protein